jgi:hypothetical protein
MDATGTKVLCHLITDESAKQLRTDAYYRVDDHEE